MTEVPAVEPACKPLTVVIAALGLLALTACSDGYPADDAPPIDPARMTQAQLLEALNDLGAGSRPGKRWRYDLDAHCGLTVGVSHGDAKRRRVVLEGAVVDTRSVDGLTEVLLLPRVGGETQAVTVLETRTWRDTVWARSLFTHLEMRCGTSAARPS